MKRTVVTVMMVLSGLCFLPACSPHTYILVENTMTWTQARDYCREKYIDLASIHNEQDHAKVYELVGENPCWIGLHPDTEAWKWSLDDPSAYGEGEAEFRRWRDGEPNDGPGYHTSCVSVLDDGRWVDRLCGVTLEFFCYKKETAETSSSIILVKELKTWDQAQSYCRENYTDLASVRNQAENDQMMEMVVGSAWIGLYRNSWKWSDGSEPSFSGWRVDAPSSKLTAACGVFYSGKWVNGSCRQQFKFVCYSAVTVRKVLKVGLKKTDTSVDMEELKEDILELFHQRLRKGGLRGGFKLRWVTQPDGKIFHKMEEEEEEEEKSCAI